MILCISGGVGGAKLVLGLSRVLDPESLTVAVNPGDDFVHLGLEVWPDFDTTLYTLAGIANPQQGWGRDSETWLVMDELRARGGEDWFNLGDKDIALHLLRAQLRSEGRTSDEIAGVLRRRFNVLPDIAPATNQLMRTIVHTDRGELPFQHYFVLHRAQPTVVRMRYDGADAARLSPTIVASLESGALEAILIAPSNPFLSIDPILAIGDARVALRRAGVPIIAVTPIIGGAAVKGPTAKIMKELGMVVSSAAVAAHYGDLIDGFVLDRTDAGEQATIEALGIACTLEQTLMQNDQDKTDLASRVLAFAKTCPKR